jgi:hypothetical protein
MEGTTTLSIPAFNPTVFIGGWTLRRSNSYLLSKSSSTSSSPHSSSLSSYSPSPYSPFSSSSMVLQPVVGLGLYYVIRFRNK